MQAPAAHPAAMDNPFFVILEKRNLKKLHDVCHNNHTFLTFMASCREPLASLGWINGRPYSSLLSRGVSTSHIFLLSSRK